MRVLFASWAGGGHFAPLVPTGWALRAAGHEVLVACHPTETGPVVRAGLPALPIGPPVDMFALLRQQRRERLRRPRPAPVAGRLDFTGMVATAEVVAGLLADELLRFCRGWRPDLVVYEPAALVGPLVATVLGIPAVRQLWCCDFTSPVNGFPRRITGPLAQRYGIDGVDPAGDRTLDPCPPELQISDDLPRMPVRYLPFNGPARMPDWLTAPARRPRVCLTWGTSLHALDPDRMRHVPAILRALGALDAELVVAVPDSQRDLFAPVPATVRMIGRIPLDLLLPSCDLLVHQGGGGTMMTAAAHGVPQVAVPSLPDQTFNAERLAGTGAGRWVGGGEQVDATEVAALAAEVLADPSYARAATGLAARIAVRPAPAAVVADLEQWVTRR
ncbi:MULTISPECIES: nucleotide disphospho-sugar-binding domain-containing protein [unclassified Solwaraspora]|uniref:nucleotide disphospho-sugar-binding domain-containing protein n=1 Tax=unclassified Solwaraspora TaxID=2627926 RepID=UPI00259B37D5|nr:nucleotide disphospho-sugar-binding domain-containing protein [Solwaraspora sp. WMMA2056]WJK38245.1 DUF1205 domain-containing protein [Solwaraspora sp. WMMA2056]